MVMFSFLLTGKKYSTCHPGYTSTAEESHDRRVDSMHVNEYLSSITEYIVRSINNLLFTSTLSTQTCSNLLCVVLNSIIITIIIYYFITFHSTFPRITIQMHSTIKLDWARII